MKLWSDFFPLACGAILGSFLRYWISGLAFYTFEGSQFFLVALVNTLGCLFMGVFSSLSLPHSLYIFIVVGFLGSFTTFSAFSAGFFQLLTKAPSLAFVYFFITLAGGFGGFICGKKIVFWVLS